MDRVICERLKEGFNSPLEMQEGGRRDVLLDALLDEFQFSIGDAGFLGP